MADAAASDPGADLERVIARCRAGDAGLDQAQLQDLTAELDRLRGAFAERAATLERERVEIEAAGAMTAELFDRAPVGYLIVDRDGVIVRANATIATMLRTTSSALVDRHLDALIAAGARASTNERLSALLRDVAVGRFESCLQRRSGSGLRVVLEGRLIRAQPDGVGHQLLLAISDNEVGTGLDITRQRQAKEDLRRSEQRFRGLFETSPMGIALVDVHTQRVLEANTAFCDILGCAVEDAQGLAVADFTDPAEWDQERRLGEEVLTRRQPSYTVRKRYRRLDGGERLVELTGSVMQGPDDQTIAVAMVQDITQRDALEARLRQAQKLEAMGQLAGGIAHDFNNLLQAIVSHASLAGRSESASERARHHEGIFAAADRACDMIQRILTFSRRSDRRVESVRLGRVVDEALELIRGGLPSTLQIAATIATPDLIVEGDASELHQVVMNLCANAVQAMHERGIVRVVLDVERIDAPVVLRAGRLEPGVHARLSVSDTGTGIPPQVLELIFDPFFTTKPAGEGTGLGLATVHGIVRGVGGAIEVETQVGVGSTIHCYLPARMAQPAAAEELQPAVPADCSGLEVLVLDDEPMLVELAGLVLTDAGARVHGFTDSAAALAQLLQDPTRYHVVLSDQTMPKLTGIELAQRLRDAQIGIPVAICSGYAREVHAVDLDRLVLRYLKKPIDPVELVRQVAQMAGR
ncbi:MAG: PAS domain-containing hybrid sensor histidine kinase/response regulator [Planctomycetota bacterium]